MTNVSKRKLDSETEQQLFEQFTTLFSRVKGEDQGALFTALFTPTERLMFIKRLAIVFLITEKYSTYAIAKTLLVSDATVRSILSQYQTGQYLPITRQMQQKTFNKKVFWETVEMLLQAGLPPRGKGRWKWLYELEDTPTIVRYRQNKK